MRIFDTLRLYIFTDINIFPVKILKVQSNTIDSIDIDSIGVLWVFFGFHQLQPFVIKTLSINRVCYRKRKIYKASNRAETGNWTIALYIFLICGINFVLLKLVLYPSVMLANFVCEECSWESRNWPKCPAVLIHICRLIKDWFVVAKIT